MMGLYHPLGPLIDPPYPQTRVRPCGVYRRPDDRVGGDGRVIIEVWNAHGECIICSSVLAREADADYEWRLWNFLDERTDMRRAVNDRLPRPESPRWLRIVPSIER